MKLPNSIITLLEKESAGLIHGKIILEIHLRDGLPRYVLKKESSILPTVLENTK